jgi:aconitate hydratase
MLRKRGVVGQFVEFCGKGCKNLSLTDRATIANMSPEYGATMGFFPVDEQTIKYLESIGTDPHKINVITSYLKAQGLFDVYDQELYGSGERMSLDLSTVVPCVSGPKRPHDRVTVKDLKSDFATCMANPQGFKGFAVPEADRAKEAIFNFEGKDYTFKHGSVVIAAITSCTNTSNPGVMMQAGLLARNALEKGLTTNPYIKTSLSPGSGVVTAYMEKSGVDKDLAALGFTTAGYGCMTCIGNSGNLPDVVNNCITENDMVASAVLSGNRNFEGRVHPLTKGNYLASPALVVAYAIAGTVNIDFEVEPLGMDKDGNPVMLKDIWPARSFVNDIVTNNLTPQMFKDFYANTLTRNQRWNNLEAPTGDLFEWSEDSTYIHYPPFFAGMSKETPTEVRQVKDAHCLCLFGDSITTDHISPAGNIAKTSAAAKFLSNAGVEAKDFNSYGSRRGNDLVMARGTFANVRIINKMVEKPGPNALHIPSGEQMQICDAAFKYVEEGHPLIILAGKEYGSGSSRDWAAKGPYLQGIKVVIAQSYERIHRSNLLGMGIMPLQFKEGESAETHGLTGHEKFTFEWGNKLSINQDVTVTTSTGKTFTAMSRLDTEPEIAYYMNGGILHYVLRKLF